MLLRFCKRLLLKLAGFLKVWRGLVGTAAVGENATKGDVGATYLIISAGFIRSGELDTFAKVGL